ncbi:MAG TPA: TetR family transcriptional regulator [Cryomorphaceae bacterium]|nr:TetR family transcriptional regulator [Owenweeksia sp.]MBF98543.1 TetR family transcriptional regulator [Owenweeksia sp.]HAD96103.1 TetR family transcriptional regulator [Cryomorphaceae bacterium]HBF18499.1 TetR family transcriptional regulator [Cryomorphaceae bacterium]HCQ16983.1 TetR family transcriptional regulator [Cryomorphaceae bacterium]|tara:strand:+ start:830 stop:1411 length:582 start_codon:yes stop_codon:yes gene_type:complete
MSKAAATRHMILEKAFALIYRKGYQATSLDDILATTAVTKGAFYYHFKSKDEMGLAMINEVLYPGMQRVMIEPLLHATDGVHDIVLMMTRLLYEVPDLEVKYGCPAVNLIDELAASKPEFKNALNKLFQEWKGALSTVLGTSREQGKLNPRVQPGLGAQFIIIGYSGARNLGKLQGSEAYQLFLSELQNYLKP